MREAFPWNQAPRYALRDRDAIYGPDFVGMMKGMAYGQKTRRAHCLTHEPHFKRRFMINLAR
jgi:hypothetical protein